VPWYNPTEDWVTAACQRT